MIGQCVESWTCWEDGECGPGWMCDDRGTCVPTPCEDDLDCAEGCYCDPETGQCVETGFCQGDDECELMGFPGFTCDERGTCVPPESRPDPGACSGEILCEEGAPECPEDTTAGIADGCYTGECVPVEECKEDPLPTCDQIETEDGCYDRLDCNPSYIGVDCTCEGGGSCRCTAEDVTCTCESYEYAGCLSL